jgi:hypothetical protein
MTQPAWPKPWSSLTIETNEVLTIVVSSVERSMLRQRLTFGNGSDGQQKNYQSEVLGRKAPYPAVSACSFHPLG